MLDPEDNDEFIPEMPDGYGKEFLDSDSHRNIEDISDQEFDEMDGG